MIQCKWWGKEKIWKWFRRGDLICCDFSQIVWGFRLAFWVSWQIGGIGWFESYTSCLDMVWIRLHVRDKHTCRSYQKYWLLIINDWLSIMRKLWNVRISTKREIKTNSGNCHYFICVCYSVLLLTPSKNRREEIDLSGVTMWVRQTQ